MRIFGESYPVKAQIEMIEGFSAHNDLDELVEWFEFLRRPPNWMFAVKGEEDTSLSFVRTLETRFGTEVMVPEFSQMVELG